MNDGTTTSLTEAKGPPPFVPGFYRDMASETYHAVEAMSSSGARKMIRAPAHYKLMRDTPNEPTDAMQFGTAVHACVLEPDMYDRNFAVTTFASDGRTKAGKEEREAFRLENAGKIILTPEQVERVTACTRALRAHPIMAKLLADKEGVEESCFWTDQRWHVPCKVRWDMRSRGGLVDIKTTRDASPDAFARSAAEFYYHVQESHYRSGAENVLNESPRFFAFAAVESEPPHLAALYYLPPEAVRVGGGWVDLALERYAKALETGRWGGYPETIDRLPFPRWAMRVNA